MGILSDLVVVEATGLQAVFDSENPAVDFNGIDIKGIDTVKFSSLHEIALGQSFEEALDEYDQPIFEASEDGPWVFQVPERLIERLSGLDPIELGKLGSLWSQKEEFVLDSWSETDVTAALTEIARLSKEAKKRDLTMFLWMSL